MVESFRKHWLIVALLALACGLAIGGYVGYRTAIGTAWIEAVEYDRQIGSEAFRLYKSGDPQQARQALAAHLRYLEAMDPVRRSIHAVCEYHRAAKRAEGLVYVMIDEVRGLLDQYAQWVRDKSILREVNEQYVEITTPYLDRHNDYTQIYVRKDDGGFVLTDGGDTIQDLRASGCDLETSKRRELLGAALNGFGVRREGDALLVKATTQDFSLRKHNLVQAILAVNDLFYLAVPVVASLFLEDVTAWLELHDIRFTPNVKFTGRSGYDHTFDFVVPASRRAPERLIRAVNRPSRDLAEAMAFSWVDTKEVRPAASKFYAFLNDENRPPTTSIVDALRNYDIVPVIWSARDSVRQELAA